MAATAEALLAIYLNDHLAGAVAGTELARRLAGAEGAENLRRLASEIEEDRAALRDIMSTLGAPVRRYKLMASWFVEKATRLKFNGQLLSRSPLSRVIELETLRLGVEGKAAAWRVLRTRAETDPRLDAARLDDLIARALRQIAELEQLRVRAAVETFGGEVVEQGTPAEGGTS
jgi:hypothetical protein